MIVEVDSSQFPVVIFRSLPVEVSDRALEEYLIFFDNFIKTSEKIVIIHDINKARFLSGDQLSRIRNWSLANKEVFAEKQIETCVVSSSILSTLIIKAIRLLLKKSFDSEIFSSMDAALSWAKKRLNEKISPL